MRRKIAILIVLSFLGTFFISTKGVLALTLGTSDQKVQTAYDNAKTSHLKALNLYSEALSKWQQAKTKLSQGRNTGTIAEAEVAAQNLALRSGESMIAFLELMRIGVQNIQGISDADRAKVLSEIDQDLAWLRSKKEVIRSTTSGTEIKALTLELKNYWNNEKANIKRWTGIILAASANRVLSRLDGVVVKVNAQIEILRNKGQDVTNLEAEVQKLQNKITEAQNSYNSAAQQYKSIKDLGQADAFFTAGNADLKATDTALREAYKILRDIISEIKTLSQNI